MGGSEGGAEEAQLRLTLGWEGEHNMRRGRTHVGRVLRPELHRALRQLAGGGEQLQVGAREPREGAGKVIAQLGVLGLQLDDGAGQVLQAASVVRVGIRTKV